MRDQDRDYNRDIRQLVDEFRRKIDELSVLLEAACREREDLSMQL